MRKKLIAGVLLFVMIFVCFGCGKGDTGTSYKITVQSGENGTVDAVSSAKPGEDVTVTVKPDKGCVVLKFAVNGKDELANMTDNTYVIEDIEQDTTIEVKFFKYPYSVTYADQKPTIDGKVDDCWKDASAYEIKEKYDSETTFEDVSTGDLRIMWDEENLYILCEVKDHDVTEMDRLNLWISETYLARQVDYWAAEQVGFSGDPADGRYYSIITPNGTQLLYDDAGNTPVDFDKDVEGYERKCSVTEDGYIVEVKIPKQSQADWKAGAEIGFDVSIDSYLTGNEERVAYSYLFGVGSYWKYAEELQKMLLTK